MTTGVPANSSISRSLKLSPMAITSSRRQTHLLCAPRQRVTFCRLGRRHVYEREVAMDVFRHQHRILQHFALRRGVNTGLPRSSSASGRMRRPRR